ncbi:3-methyladenine DNA glycosylase [Photobacterium damselae subsp. damselae]|uniref:3-methyladenine DNA glycosylase n=1 Tax=Photobacterium damselae TaxID=38293 RepID=A0ACD3T1N7_PHODM|nr:DNA-3-methyladenine glycosylase I [Photobacterium damselae]MCG9706805.1 DNA-3-methyladenine glycosylase I [Photobacterium damselae]PSB88353.1 3-methyladenine DNA glycosylase [Photobacterium damselae subsp. damselae]RDL31634.1 3-methyladenine DNA glycosylase [Photobacterium damselae]TMX66682.1 3-methyladenine DNA glycosylase [Photobacterium damselae]TMX76988.1 3-methyladenine DNA glycosylase [Photobacterium damselae]
MVREKFNQIYDRAAERKGGIQALEKLLVVPKNQQELALITDDRWLATFTLRIFQSGMTWQVVRNKWPNFEDVFFGFNIEKMLLVPDEMWERKATDPAIIRHLGKVMTIPANADMIHRAAVEYGSFAQMVADWPCEDIIGLWQYLKKKGARLGGNTGPYALRTMGKDTFIISQDVEAYLRNIGVIEGGKSSLKSLKATQKAFNDWQQESGRPMCQVSQIISFSCGDNHVF